MRAASPRGGGCSAQSDLKAFASTEELVPSGAAVRSIPRPSRLAEPLAASKQTAKGLAALGIATHGDLIEHLPHTHRDRREVRGLAAIGVGEEATVAVTVRGVSVRPMRDRRRKRVEAKVFDDTGPALAVWWNQPWIASKLGEGAAVLLHGRKKRRNEFWVDEYELLGQGTAPVHTVGLVPVHPATYGLSAGSGSTTWRISL